LLRLQLGVGDLLLELDIVLGHGGLSLERVGLPLGVGSLVLDNVRGRGCGSGCGSGGSRCSRGSNGDLGSLSLLDSISSGSLGFGSGLSCLSLCLSRCLLGRSLCLLLLLLIMLLGLLSLFLALGSSFGSFGLNLAICFQISSNLLGKSFLVCSCSLRLLNLSLCFFSLLFPLL